VVAGLAAAALAAGAVGCTATAVGSEETPGKAAPATTAPAPAGSDDDKPSPTASGEPTAEPQPKVLMADGTENEQVRELQARLRRLGHFERSPTAFYGSITVAAVKAFQKSKGLPATGSVDETTWERLTATTPEPTRDELRPATTYELDEPDPRCMTGRVLCISKESRTLAWMIDGKVVSAMDVRFGAEDTPTDDGTFKVNFKSRDHVSTKFHTPMPYALFFNEGEAVHYSADFAARGYDGASHGCVNVRDKKKVAAIFNQVRVGDKVVVYW
jgi:lipoprotein-anchoring transpeptidase ErfK/SrfK